MEDIIIMIDRIINFVQARNLEYTREDIKNRCLEGEWRLQSVKSDLKNNPAVYFTALKSFVLRSVLSEKGVFLKNGKYESKLPTSDIDLTLLPMKQDQNKNLIQLLFKASNLPEEKIVILCLYYDLDLPVEFFDKYKEILTRDPGAWNLKQISIYLKKDPKEVHRLFRESIKELKKYDY